MLLVFPQSPFFLTFSARMTKEKHTSHVFSHSREHQQRVAGQSKEKNTKEVFRRFQEVWQTYINGMEHVHFIKLLHII